MHQLPYAEEMGLGTRNYELISLDDDLSGFDKAVNMVKNQEAVCLVLKDNKIISNKQGAGLTPLLELLDNESEIVRDATVVDKKIGKAAAFILIKARVRTVYGETITKDALKLLNNNHIPATYGKLVEKILNKEGNNVCPMEKTIEGVEDVNEAVEIIRGKMDEFKK